jgi:hypothetical protein
VRELVQLVLNKHRRRKEQIEWIEEIFGTELSKCFATDCLVLINYKDDVQELHVYFGGINAPTGHGHGHYIFKLINGSVRLRRVRDPANF